MQWCDDRRKENKDDLVEAKLYASMAASQLNKPYVNFNNAECPISATISMGQH